MTPGLKIISAATGVDEPCADVSTGGRRNQAAFIYCSQLSPSDTLHLALLPQSAAITAVIFIPLLSQYGSRPWPPIWTVLITHYFQMITAEVFANSKAIWLIRAFGLTVHNRPHVPPSACRYCFPCFVFYNVFNISGVLTFLSLSSPFGCRYEQKLNNPIFCDLF